ncbi:MAG: LacI family DNA-binding transcriptional regulator [Anaerolineae bacterium]
MGMPDRKTVTQKDVAKHAGVSSAVVSYVVNNGPRQVSEETRQRVLTAVRELGYRPNKFAQALSREDGGVAENQIGIIVGGGSTILQRPFYAAVLSGIFDTVHQTGNRIRFMHFWEDLKDPVLFNEHIHEEEISAIMLLAADLMRVDPGYMALIERIETRIENIVCLDTHINDFTTVTFDRIGAARTIVEHFIALGHTRIGFIGNEGRRVAGYKLTLEEHGLDVNPAYIQHPGIHNSSEEGFNGAQAILALPAPPTAIFAASDEVAVGVLSAIQSVGLRVPDDIAVASIDNSPFARFTSPPLTAINVPTEQMGAYALHVINTQRMSPRQRGTTITIDTELIIRISCGAQSKQ